MGYYALRNWSSLKFPFSSHYTVNVIDETCVTLLITLFVAKKNSGEEKFFCLNFHSGFTFNKYKLDLFHPSVACHIETRHLICYVNQISGFYMKSKTGLKWIKGNHYNSVQQ